VEPAALADGVMPQTNTTMAAIQPATDNPNDASRLIVCMRCHGRIGQLADVVSLADRKKARNIKSLGSFPQVTCERRFCTVRVVQISLQPCAATRSAL
jgi:cytochrome c553